MKVDIMICTKDRPSELALLLQSLRTQTHKDFNIFIYDDRSGVPYQNYHFMQCLINQLKLENHNVTIWRNDIVNLITQILLQHIFLICYRTFAMAYNLDPGEVLLFFIF